MVEFEKETISTQKTVELGQQANLFSVGQKAKVVRELHAHNTGLQYTRIGIVSSLSLGHCECQCQPMVVAPN